MGAPEEQGLMSVHEQIGLDFGVDPAVIRGHQLSSGGLDMVAHNALRGTGHEESEYAVVVALGRIIEGLTQARTDLRTGTPGPTDHVQELLLLGSMVTAAYGPDAVPPVFNEMGQY